MKLRMLGLLGVMASGNAALAADARRHLLRRPHRHGERQGAGGLKRWRSRTARSSWSARKPRYSAPRKGKITQLRDLKGQTMTPGFIDPHSHFIDPLSIADRVNVFGTAGWSGRQSD